MSAVNPMIESLANMAVQLTPSERAQLIEKLVESLVSEEGKAKPPRRISYGALSDLNLDVSEEDIAEARKDMWCS